MSNQVRIQDIDRQIQDLQSLSPLLKKYVEMDNEEYKQAKKLVSERLKIQERIKKIMKEHHLTNLHTKTDELDIDLEFKINVRDEIDDIIVPDNIKNMYLKQVEIWKENLTVKSRL